MDAKRHEAAANSAEAENLKDDGSARARLIEAATQLFAEHGLEGTSTRDIAKAAELNISLISYYFGGKEGLYRSVINEYAERVRQQTDRLLANLDVPNLSKENFQIGMKNFIGEMVPWKLAGREMHVLLQREMMLGLPHAKEIFENVFASVLEKIVGLYRAGQQKGFVRPDVNPYIVFFSMVHATDMYLQMSKCQTKVQEKLLKLPEKMDQYTHQIYLIFVEGVLL